MGAEGCRDAKQTDIVIRIISCVTALACLIVMIVASLDVDEFTQWMFFAALFLLILGVPLSETRWPKLWPLMGLWRSYTGRGLYMFFCGSLACGAFVQQPLLGFLFGGFLMFTGLFNVFFGIFKGEWKADHKADKADSSSAI